MIELELKPEVFQQYLKNPFYVGLEKPDVYSHIGNFAYLSFTKGNERLQTGGVAHGFGVIGRLIRIAAHLYPEYCIETKKEKDADELQTILLGSKDTPGMFQDMPNDANREVETIFGINEGVYPPANAERLFYFAKSGNSSLPKFVPRPSIFTATVLNAANQLPDGTQPTSCPMQDLTREVIWPEMVSLSRVTSQAFAHSLGLEDNRS